MVWAVRDAWPIEREEALRVLWADGGLSACEIGERLGVTRNAVLGKAHRMRLPPKFVPERLGRTLVRTTPRKARVREKAAITISNGRYGGVAIVYAAREFQKPVVSTGTSRTAPAYRNQLGFMAESSANQRRLMIAEAFKNTAALEVADD